jgi:chromosome segregation ATPase
MERQRMIEWENTRKQDLTNQKMKTQEEVHRLKSKKKSLAIDMEQVNNKLNELNGVVAETRKKVVDVKAEIDSMRLERDQKLGLLSSIKAQVKSLNDRQLYIEQEKINLTQQLKNSSTTGIYIELYFIWIFIKTKLIVFIIYIFCYLISK